MMNIIKDRDEWPDEEAHDKVRKDPNAGASILVGLGCTTRLARRCVHKLRSSPNPIIQTFLMEV